MESVDSNLFFSQSKFELLGVKFQKDYWNFSIITFFIFVLYLNICHSISIKIIPISNKFLLCVFHKHILYRDSCLPLPQLLWLDMVNLGQQIRVERTRMVPLSYILLEDEEGHQWMVYQETAHKAPLCLCLPLALSVGPFLMWQTSYSQFPEFFRALHILTTQRALCTVHNSFPM